MENAVHNSVTSHANDGLSFAVKWIHHDAEYSKFVRLFGFEVERFIDF